MTEYQWQKAVNCHQPMVQVAATTCTVFFTVSIKLMIQVEAKASPLYVHPMRVSYLTITQVLLTPIMLTNS
jgi:hypothetical protein